MKEQNNSVARHFDTPIPKPPDEVLERFVRSTEARFVTKRFTSDRNRQTPNKIERIEAR